MNSIYNYLQNLILINILIKFNNNYYEENFDFKKNK